MAFTTMVTSNAFWYNGGSTLPPVDITMAAKKTPTTTMITTTEPPKDHHHDHHHEEEEEEVLTTMKRPLEEIPAFEKVDINMVMSSIAPDFKNKTINGTIFGTEERPHWQKVLDKVVTLIMTFNVVGLMLGMGCAIYWKDVGRLLKYVDPISNQITCIADREKLMATDRNHYRNVRSIFATASDWIWFFDPV